MIEYHQLLTFGDCIELKFECDTRKLLEEIKDFEWLQYNPRKKINRYGLSITSLDGKRNGIDLDSLWEYNKENNTKYGEENFKTKTDVYYASEETRKLCEPFDPWLCRTHFLNFRRGGFFPLHRDQRTTKLQKSFRILVPITHCNPGQLYFIYDNKIMNFKHGTAYFLNTNKEHAVFSYSDKSVMLVMNIECTPESVEKVMTSTRYA
jgi:hypothetical protein